MSGPKSQIDRLLRALDRLDVALTGYEDRVAAEFRRHVERVREEERARFEKEVERRVDAAVVQVKAEQAFGGAAESPDMEAEIERRVEERLDARLSEELARLRDQARDDNAKLAAQVDRAIARLESVLGR